jgi:hypothetical protein
MIGGYLQGFSCVTGGFGGVRSGSQGAFAGLGTGVGARSRPRLSWRSSVQPKRPASAFEARRLPARPFDPVFTATSYVGSTALFESRSHRMPCDPAVGCRSSQTHHCAGGDEPFFVEVRRCHRRSDSDAAADCGCRSRPWFSSTARSSVQAALPGVVPPTRGRHCVRRRRRFVFRSTLWPPSGRSPDPDLRLSLGPGLWDGPRQAWLQASLLGAKRSLG